MRLGCFTLAKGRRALSLGISALVVIVLIIVAGFGAYLNATFNTTSTTNSTSYSSSSSSSPTATVLTNTTITFPGNFPSSAVEFNSSLGLELELALNSTSIKSGQAISINVTEYNALNSVNNVTKAGDWAISGLTLGGCGTLNYPLGIEIFKGNYSVNNISSLGAQTGLLFYHPGAYSCPAIFFVTDYEFEPASNIAAIQIMSSPSSSVGPYPMTSAISASGSWTGGNAMGTGAVYHILADGVYTVVAGDEWGNIALEHFMVS